MVAKLTILVGPPAAGKSTWRQHYKGEVISTDSIRNEEFGVQYDPRIEPLVWRRAYQRLARALAQGKDVCFDATNVTKARRRPLINMARAAGAQVEAVVINPGLEVLLKRDAARPPGKKVGREVLLNIYRQLELPTLDEGFDRIEFVNNSLKDM
ncbi:MAG: ATP-binding protein [Clostridia bacterium]|nr:ATP-binding protein [Clostridia bacterium]